jgi:hypothetical protein
MDNKELNGVSDGGGWNLPWAVVFQVNVTCEGSHRGSKVPVITNASKGASKLELDGVSGGGGGWNLPWAVELQVNVAREGSHRGSKVSVIIDVSKGGSELELDGVSGGGGG